LKIPPFDRLRVVSEVEPPKAGIVEGLRLLAADPEGKSVDNMLWAMKIFPFRMNPLLM
jgi:hypothetical protein